MKDLFNFISSIVSSVSWPLSIVIVAALLKKPLSMLVARIGKLKYGDLEAEFSKSLEEVNDILPKTLVKTALKISGSAEVEVTFNRTISEETSEIAKISPEAAIPYAWMKIENAISRKATNANITEASKLSGNATKIAAQLYENNVIEASTYSAIKVLGQLRNSVVHHGSDIKELNIVTAFEYGKSAERLVDELNK